MTHKRIQVVMLGAYPADPARMRGGVEAAYAYLVKGLVRMNNMDLHILTFKPNTDQSAAHQSEANPTFHTLPGYPRFERVRNFSTYQRIVNKYLQEIKPDLLHAQDAGADALVAIRSGLPTVVTIHGIRWEDGKHYSSLRQRLHVFYDSLITERYVVSHARNMIAISPYVTNYFKKNLRPDLEIFYVPNAIDERFFIQDNRPDQQIVFFAGRVIPRKRVMDLVQAFALVKQHVPAAQLRIAGETSTEPAYVDHVKKWVHEANLDASVFFLGALPEDQILQEFAACSILALPSAQETLPMVIAQAMAAGKPVVATRVGGVGEMVSENLLRGFLVNVGDIQNLSKSIVRLLEYPSLYHRMGQNGRAFARKNYHFESVALHTNEVYQHIALKKERADD